VPDSYYSPANQDDPKASPFGAHAPRRLADVDDGTWGGRGADIIGNKLVGAGPLGVKALSRYERGAIGEAWAKPPGSPDAPAPPRSPGQEWGASATDKATADPLAEKTLPLRERARLAGAWRKPPESLRLRPATDAPARHHVSGRRDRLVTGCALVGVSAIVVAVLMTLLVHPW